MQRSKWSTDHKQPEVGADLLIQVALSSATRPGLVARTRHRLAEGSLATPEQVAGVLVAGLRPGWKRSAPGRT